MVMVIVDGNNVIGSVPDGWWRDLPAAVRRLLARLVCFGRQADVEVVLVLDVAQADLPEGAHDGVEVRYPQRPGRNAADSKILELLANVGPERSGDRVEVVTSDRALAASAADAGAIVTGARTFLARLDDLDC